MCTYIHTCRNPHPKMFFNFTFLPTDHFGFFVVLDQMFSYYTYHQQKFMRIPEVTHC